MLRSLTRWCGLLALGGLLLLSLASLYGPSRTPVFGGSSLSSHSMTVVAWSASSSSVIGGPSLSATFIDHVLARYGSPAVGLGHALVSDSQQFDIDDAVALAFFLHESS